ncbi:MAG: YifB family Mg chelatase-like AAA ATPase [Treponemataceae bacterium]|nr:YifB family Mg chelatase-like AAA ATPase [Treponemataceae bacterium]
MYIASFSPFGYEGALVTVEVDLRRGIPAIDVVGLADNAVREARERMRAAIRNSGFEFPQERVLISLSPADVKKEGAGFDLAIALAVLDAAGSDDRTTDDIAAGAGVLVMGELELSGKVRPVRGINAAVSTAAENGIRWCIVPRENAAEAQSLGKLQVFAVESLQEAQKAWCALSSGLSSPVGGVQTPGQQAAYDEQVAFPPADPNLDFSAIAGQKQLVRALQIAAAGGHNVLCYGPPGCGKTLAMQRFGQLLPYMTLDEQRQVTRIYSLAGFLPENTALIQIPPFRSPHQSSSLEGMVGGGPHCMPGEVSLAHGGVLFLDEAAEFRTSVLQTLRVPLEGRSITLSRAGRHTTFPADFQLLIATNPCPCGNFGSTDRICVCSARSVESYWKKFSGPLLDRIDLRVSAMQDAAAMTAADKDQKSLSTAELRKGIGRALAIQRKRQHKKNAILTPQEIDYYCKLNDGCHAVLNAAVMTENFSSRAIHSIIRVARTIADMDGVYNIRVADLKEAIDLRRVNGPVDL